MNNLPDFLAQDHYGHIHLTGHRIGLRHVVDSYNDACTPEMIQSQYSSLELALIYKVIAYYLENRAAIEAYVLRCREAVERQAAMPQPGPSAAELRRRMDERRPKLDVCP